MTDDDDLSDVPEHLVPIELVDDVFDGRAGDDLADAVAAVAELVGAARRPPSAVERSEVDAAVAAFVAVVAMVEGHTITPSARNPRMIARLITAKTAAIAVATLCTAGAAAAATGTLPSPAQHAVTRAANVVGLGASTTKRDGRDDRDADDGDDTDSTSTSTSTVATTTSTDASTTSTSSSSTTSTSTTLAATTSTSDDRDAEADDADEQTPVGPDVTGPAKKGLCNAYLTSKAKGHLKNPDAIAFRNLLEAASAAGVGVEDFCADVTATPATATTAGAAITPPVPGAAHGTPPHTPGNNGNGRGNGKG